MRDHEWGPLLERTCALALDFLRGLPERPVGPAQDAAQLIARFDLPLPEAACDPRDVLEELVALADPGITAMPSGRFFGWVIGGGLPAAVAADWLTGVWDQNASAALGTPAAIAAEQVALGWVASLLDLPVGSAVLVTGAQVANLVCLAAARSEVLRLVGWDVEADGLCDAPPVRVVVGAERHATVDKALRLLGFGHRRLTVIAADEEGQMRPDALASELAGSEQPTIVCAQAGNVNGGGFDPMPGIVDAVTRSRRRAPVWLHVDGAFGLWARVSPSRRVLTAGVEEADSWAVDAHKWLNTPYDCGIALVRHAEAHRRALRSGAAYLPDQDDAVRNPFDYAPELSRRARGFALWAGLRQLGRAGVTALVDRSCDLAARLAAELAAVPGVEVMNRVRINQLVVRFRDPDGRDDDAHTRAVLDRVVRGGVCYPTATVWRGVPAMRISLSNWRTDEDDLRRVVDAIARAHRGA